MAHLDTLFSNSSAQSAFQNRLMIRLAKLPRTSCLRAGSALLRPRQLHTTKVSSDFFSWFKGKKKQEQLEPSLPAKGTQELISDIEAGKKSKISNKQKLELIPENFIGEEQGEMEEKARAKLVKEVSFNSWLSRRKVSDEAQLDSLLVECYKSAWGDDAVVSVGDSKLDATFPDLVTKFNFTKALQARSGYMVPDYQLTTLTTPSQFKSYYTKEVLSGKQSRYKESEPNAIHLSPAQFTQPNIYIIPDVKIKSQKETYRKVVKEVNLLEAENTRRAIEQARRS